MRLRWSARVRVPEVCGHVPGMCVRISDPSSCAREFSLAGALSVPNHDPRVVEVSAFVTDGHVCASKIFDIFVLLGARCPVRLLWSAGRV